MKKVNKLCVFPFLLVGFALMITSSCEKDSNDSNDDAVLPIDTTGTTPTIPSGWSKVGDINANNMIWSLTSDASGNIYAGGYFTNVSGYNYVAKWNGTVWSDIGLNANDGIMALTTDASDNIYAVGFFSNGVTPDGGNHYVAKWDGASWSDIGQSHSDLLLTADGVGNVYNGPSKWNGIAWNNFGILNPDIYGSILALETNPSGDAQYGGGDFALSSGYRYIAQWDGITWGQTGSLNANNNIQALAVDNSGNVYAAGSFTNGALPSTGYCYVAKWDGTEWSELGSLNANGSIYNLAIDKINGYIYASGYFSSSQGYYVAKWDGTSWSDLGNMLLAPTPIYVDDSGKLYSVIASEDGTKYCVVVHD